MSRPVAIVLGVLAFVSFVLAAVLEPALVAVLILVSFLAGWLDRKET